MRVGAVAEMLGAVRMIKFFGWEELVTEKLVKPKREAELRLALQRGLFEATIRVLYSTLPLANLIVVFTLITRVKGESITPSLAYTAIAFFASIQNQFGRTLLLIAVFANLMPR